MSELMSPCPFLPQKRPRLPWQVAILKRPNKRRCRRLRGFGEARAFCSRVGPLCVSWSRSQLDRLLDPRNVSVTLDTITRAARALGKRIIIRMADGKAKRA